MAATPTPPDFARLDTRDARVVVIDDDEAGRELTAEMLRLRGYSVQAAASCHQGREVLQAWPPDLILMDVVLPDGSGIDLCREVKQSGQSRLVPVILITGLTDHDSKIRGIEAGADDFLNKPVDPSELFARAESLVKLKRYTDELENAEDVLFSLAMGVEARDKYTQGHCQRLAHQAASLGQRLGLPADDVVALRRGGVLHDIGKISVPDAILRKPGDLTEEEWVIMRRHPGSGAEICRPLRSLARVLPIIRHHHEHWNGAGYPDHLAGDAIPLLARILQVVDAYDALTTERPYKPAWPAERAREQLLAESGRDWWDPHIISEYLDLLVHDPPPVEPAA
ncbi:MAG: HD-GYP domain-containing protein [Terriglobales bacterium]